MRQKVFSYRFDEHILNKIRFYVAGMNTYNTFFGFYALSNTPMWLDYEENNRINKY